MIVASALHAAAAEAGHAYHGLLPANPPWPGGMVPYVFDAALGVARRKAYLDGVREWELAANIHFPPRTTGAHCVIPKYDPFGPNRASGTNPQAVGVNALTRARICHEMGSRRDSTTSTCARNIGNTRGGLVDHGDPCQNRRDGDHGIFSSHRGG